jgi:sterol desaturase/sphingolipid hydroxylase (fatty acid hydroxylase superfamily)
MTYQEWLLVSGGDLQVVLFFGLFAALLVTERSAPMRRHDMTRRSRWPANLGLTTLNLVVLSVLPVSLISVALWASEEGWGLLNQLAQSQALVTVVTLLLRAFLSFFTHWLAHKVPLLWRIHRVHHLDTEMDVSTTVRFHPAEFILNLSIGIPFVIAFGLSPWVLMLYEMFDVCVTLWSHSNIRVPERADRLLRYFVVTPNLHRIHHSTWQPETDSNFGAVFPIWDIVFGTFRPVPKDGHETMRIGLEEVRGRRANQLTWLLVSPFTSDLSDAPRHVGESLSSRETACHEL